ncbi:acetaldehyde dehydrogenase [Clostridium carboxidivorans P7]|uniref:Acetaldehyde dehydrogenase (Acetylating) n=1 Tax=Clostridium carboxidivorans P7 TaxID=536227 RepID=C6PNQ9_9CLOT|nr:acetaldehyde dehydrogenase (acetylating) [Clostridium carboxidivorans]AKN32812.1 acetaldehyde dehydrogenase [Clostridium carboxidivorans P7]EET89186.1 acetaldehyde dehydrogenase (acetylating) [Clostridium carboxidivorans P7]EFG89945.1 acetaldehyde dehydrogenase (acetylating) [Clostridium carboxidivorans P7]
MENFDKDLRSIQEARNLARLGKVAANKIADYTEEQIDKILRNMVKVAEEHAVCLAQMAVEETGFGKAEDKTFKNHLASTILYNSIKDMKTIGIVKEDTINKLIEIAEPVGLVMGIVPSTNPTSTAIFKAMISIKSRNAIVFSPHPSAAKCTTKAVQLMHDAAVAAGAPENIISAVSIPTIGATNELMKCSEVSIIIATGGPGMVKAAYSSGKPALGVGAGNSPAYIERTADVEKAVKNIMASKTFDNGTICASEQSIICEECNHDKVVEEFKKQGGYFMTKDETDKVCQLLFKNGHAMNAKFVGRSPQVIADAAGIVIPEGTRVLIGKQNGVGEGNPLSFEKLTTVLGFYTVKDWHEACELSIELLQNGIGHTMSLHTEDRDIVMKFARKPASRILVNTGGTQGGTGASTGLKPSFTLGCGTWGGSSVSENVTPEHLVNIKRVAYGIKDCTTLAVENKTFSCCTKTTESCNEIENAFMNMSPAQIAAAAAALNKVNECAETASTNNTCTNDESTKNEGLLDLVNQIVAAIKEAN